MYPVKLSTTAQDLAEHMYIPWLKRDNEMTLSDVKKLPSERAAEIASSITSSDDPLRQFLDANYIPLVQKMQEVQEQLMIAKEFLKSSNDPHALNCLQTMEESAKKIREKSKNALSLQDIIEDEDEDEEEN